MATKALCSIEECGKPAEKRGWCGAHYRRWQRLGDPTAGKPMRCAPGAKNAWLANHVGYEGDDCLRWPFYYNPNGYGDAVIGGEKTSANRAMCEMAHGKPPTPDHEATHSCGNGAGGCLNPRHLRWRTATDNQNERLEHGTDIRGEKSVHAKLTESQVRAIREMEGKDGPTAIGRRYGISKTAVMLIWNRTNWHWLE